MKWLAVVFVLLLGGAPLTAGADGSRLTIVNEPLEPTRGAAYAFPLYLSRFGTYYLELYREADELDRDIVLPVNVSFERGGERILSRELDVHYAPGERVTTLFFVDSPSDLPHRKALDLVVEFPAATTVPGGLRVQMTRKKQILPFGR